MTISELTAKQRLLLMARYIKTQARLIANWQHRQRLIAKADQLEAMAR